MEIVIIYLKTESYNTAFHYVSVSLAFQTFVFYTRRDLCTGTLGNVNREVFA